MTQKPWFLPLLVFLGVAGIMLATAPLVDDSFGEEFTSPDNVDRPLIPELVARIGQHATPSNLPFISRYRFIPCVLFSFAVAAAFARLRMRCPTVIGWIAVIALLTMPQLFVVAHTATREAIAGSCVLLLWALFPWACQNFVLFAVWLSVGAIGLLVDVRVCAALPMMIPTVMNIDPKVRSTRVRYLLMGAALLIMFRIGFQVVLKFDRDFLGAGLDWNSLAGTRVGLTDLVSVLLGCPEWHLALAIIGIWKALKYWRIDIESLDLVLMELFAALLLNGPVRLIFLGPLAAMGAGRLLYRGTLIKPFRIPPAGWAMVLLVIATVRSAVIMVTWAPKWGHYKNRIGLMIDRPNLP